MLLALDTATARVSVALLGSPAEGEPVTVLAEALGEQPMRHGEQLAPCIEHVLARSGAGREDLTAIAVGIGPGPFTGLRVGLVTARVMSAALGIPVYGVCTLDVLAVQAVVTGALDGLDLEAGFLVASDARRKEVYWAHYDATAERLRGPEVGRPAQLPEGLASLPTVGAGPHLYPDALPRAVGPEQPSAAVLGLAVAQERVPLGDPEPLYLRRPDALAPGPRKPVS